MAEIEFLRDDGPDLVVKVGQVRRIMGNVECNLHVIGDLAIYIFIGILLSASEW